mmetsp:Transcript_120/g.366  ORF Transcript_120/g.366 Transcript_120/m.366 type:complete len:146 (+) Transcript_120:1480-1917(+)
MAKSHSINQTTANLHATLSEYAVPIPAQSLSGLGSLLSPLLSHHLIHATHITITRKLSPSLFHLCTVEPWLAQTTVHDVMDVAYPHLKLMPAVHSWGMVPNNRGEVVGAKPARIDASEKLDHLPSVFLLRSGRFLWELSSQSMEQ